MHMLDLRACCARNPRIKILKRIVAEHRSLAVPKLDSTHGTSSDSLCISDVENEDRSLDFDVLQVVICPASSLPL